MSKEGSDRGRQAHSPRQLGWAGWKDVLWRVKRQIEVDHIPIIAAGLAFYAMLALFPTLIALLSIYGLVASAEQVSQQVSQLYGALPSGAAEVIDQQLSGIAGQSGGLGWGAILGLVGALWAASTGTQALIKGVNLAYDEEEKRGFVKLRAVALLMTVGLILAIIVAVAAIVFVPIVLGYIGLGGAAETLIRIGRWPALAVLTAMGLAVVYRYAPDRREAKWRWVTWGSAIATVLWLVASLGFSWYVDNFGNYNEVYGSIGGVIVLLLWLYLSAFVVLLGAELDSELEAQTAKDSTVGPDRPMGERDAVKADNLGETLDDERDAA